MGRLTDTIVEFCSPSGAVMARVALTPMRKATNDNTAPLLEIDDEDAREHG